VEVAAEERGDVGAGLRDDKVVYVEEFGYSGEGGVAVGSVAKRGGGAEVGRVCGGPGDDVALFVFTFHGHGGVENVGCVGS